jgi:hypothetical protein
MPCTKQGNHNSKEILLKKYHHVKQISAGIHATEKND